MTHRGPFQPLPFCDSVTCPECCCAAVALVPCAKGSPLRQHGAPLAGSPKGNAVTLPWLRLSVAPKKASSGSLWHTGNVHSCGGRPVIPIAPVQEPGQVREPYLHNHWSQSPPHQLFSKMLPDSVAAERSAPCAHLPHQSHAQTLADTTFA